MIELVLLLVALVLILLCGIFVAAEFSLLAVNRSTLETLSENGDRGASGILQALGSLSTQLSGAQVGITVTNLAIGFLAEPAISELLRQPIASIFPLANYTDGISLVLGVVIATAATMVLGELIPKNLAIALPIQTARFVQRPQRLFTKTIAGPIRFLNASANFLLKRVGVEPQEELASARSADELLSLVRRSAEKGTLPKETAEMMERSLNFGDLTALDVMTPRLRVKSVLVTDPVSRVLSLAKKTGLSRFPVTGESIDEIVGIAHIKRALTIPRNKRVSTEVEAIMYEPVFVPSGLQLESLLEQLRSGGMQMAVVVDEFGGVDGIVTIEDLLEELVGEVHDEHDPSRAAIKPQGKNQWQISGLLRPDEINEELDVVLPEKEEYETIGGLVTLLLERIPIPQDEVKVPTISRDGKKCTAVLRVEKMEGLRIDRLTLRIEDRQEPEEEE